MSIKYKCAASPSVNRFLVLVYKDVWMHSLLETWEVIVHALQRVDLHALVGQTSVAKALLRGDAQAAHGLVRLSPRSLPSAPHLRTAQGHRQLRDIHVHWQLAIWVRRF